MSRARNWCFTKNNPTTNDITAHSDERYIVWQREKGDNGTEHLQGYVELTRAVNLSNMKTWLPGAHFEQRRGTREQAADYCKKEESRVDGPWTRGDFGQGRGKRNDIIAVRDLISSGASKREVYEEFPEIAAKYPRFVDTYIGMTKMDGAEKLMEIVPKYEWQSKVLEMVESPPDNRQLLWVYDPVGNQGKTYMSKHLVDKYGAFYSNGGKGADICYAYQGEPVVVFDYVRDSQEYVNYGVIEQIKNGILFSAKYESGMKRFKVPHVLVFANFRADSTKFSSDRLVEVLLKSDGEWDKL